MTTGWVRKHVFSQSFLSNKNEISSTIHLGRKSGIGMIRIILVTNKIQCQEKCGWFTFSFSYWTCSLESRWRVWRNCPGVGPTWGGIDGKLATEAKSPDRPGGTQLPRWVLSWRSPEHSTRTAIPLHQKPLQWFGTAFQPASDPRSPCGQKSPWRCP